MDILRTENHRGYTIEVMQDTEPESPRQWDNFGKMVCFHPRYDLGDKQNRFDTPEELQAYLAGTPCIALPLFLYDHSGLTMRTQAFSCRWDSGQVGMIFVTLKDVRKEYRCIRVSKQRREKVIEMLKGEVESFDDYLTGNVYGYQTRDKEGNECGSCWGFFGDPDSYMIPEAKAEIDWTEKARIKAESEEEKQRIKAHIEKVKAWIVNRVPLQYREPLNITGKG